MSKLGTLVRVGAKSNFGVAVLWHRIFREKKDRWLVLIFALSFAGFLPMLYGLVLFIKKLYLVLSPIGQERAILTSGILAGQTVILILGIYYVISAFYFSRDLEMLIPLPLKPVDVMVSKFFVIMANEYLTVAPIVLPVLVTFGILSKSGISYWVNTLLVYITLPVIPLAMVSVLVIAMMRFVNLSRKKDVLILIGSISLIALAFGIQFLAHRLGNEDANAGNLAAFLSSPDSLLKRIGVFFPPSIWASKAVAGGFSMEGLANLALFVGVSILFFGIMVMLAEQFFYKGLVGLAEAGVRKYALTPEEMWRRTSSGRRPVAAIFIREWRIMARTPVFLLNGIIMVVILPAFFILMAVSSKSPLGSNMQMLAASGNSLVILLFLALFMIICGTINGTSSSTFSREGAQFWISRVIPVAPQEQIAAKFLHSYLIGFLGNATALVVAVIMFHPRWPDAVTATGLALVTGVLLTSIHMIIDLARPLLDWTNPQKAIKQNLNVLFAMFADFGILTVAYFAVKALMRAEVAVMVLLGVLFAVLIGLAALSYLALIKFAHKRYSEIEN